VESIPWRGTHIAPFDPESLLFIPQRTKKCSLPALSEKPSAIRSSIETRGSEGIPLEDRKTKISALKARELPLLFQNPFLTTSLQANENSDIPLAVVQNCSSLTRPRMAS
jgi:hypothetical protein